MNQSQQARRAFLRGSFSQPYSGIRPPWAHTNFSDLCTRCNDCIEACEENIITKGDGGFPTIDFSRGGCTFCGKCGDADSCNAFDKASEIPWNNQITINNECLSAKGIVCRACGEICESRAIRFELKPGGIAEPKVDTENCNGCGFCIPVCPGNAIHMEINE